MVNSGRQSAGRRHGQPAARAVALVLLAALGALAGCTTTIQPGTNPEYAPPLPVLERGSQPVVRVAPESPDVRQVSSYQPSGRDLRSRPGYRHPAGNTRIKELLFQDVPLVIAAELLTEAGWINMMLQGPVADKNVRLYLRDVTLANAVEALLRSSELWYRSEGGITAVMSEQAFADSMVFQRSEKIQAFFLRYTNAQDMAAMLATLLGPDVELKEMDDQQVYGHLEAEVVGASADEGDEEEVLTDEERRLLVQLGEAETVQAAEEASAAVGRRTPTTLTVFKKNNAIIVRSTEEAVLRHITGLVRELDTPTRQVLLETRIIRIELGDGFDSFFDVDFSDGTWAISTLSGVGNPDSETLGVAFSKDNVEARLQLFAEANRLNVISSPFLMTADNAAVRFFVGEEVPLRTGVSQETISQPDTVSNLVVYTPDIETRELGTELDIKSVINADQTITLEITALIESPNFNVSFVPIVNSTTGEVINYPLDGVDTNELNAILAVPANHTVALGGFIKLENQDFEQKVPLLGDIPGAGYLFKKVERRAARTETVILITPHVMGHPREGTDTTERFMDRASRVPQQLERQQERIDQAKQRESWPEVAPSDENPFLQDL
jgi:general secretion pathway protein D